MLVRGQRRARLMALEGARRMPHTRRAVASVKDVLSSIRPKGVGCRGKLYLYPDGHVNLTFDPCPKNSPG